MLLDDPLEHRCVALPIPGPLGIDDGDRSTLTHTKTVGLGPEHTTTVGETQLLEPSLEITPRLQAPGFVTTFWGRLVAAKKDVTNRGIDADSDGDSSLAGAAAFFWPRPGHLTRDEVETEG